MKSYTLIDDTASNTPMVCVAMLAFNHQKFIPQAIDSALMQITDFDFQILIAEDCSSDNTRAIVLDYQNRFPEKIKLILQHQNVGMLKNDFALIENFGGNYIAILEGDDYWTDPYKLQKQVDFLELNKDYSMVFTGCEICVPNKGVHQGLERKAETRQYQPLEIFSKWIVPTASVVFRNNYKDEILKNCTHKNIIFPDIVLFLTLANKGKIYCISDVTCVYRRHAGGISVANPLFGKKAVMHFKAITEIFGQEYRKLVNFNIAKVYLNMGLVNFRKNPFSALAHIFMGLRYDYTVAVDYLQEKVNSLTT